MTSALGWRVLRHLDGHPDLKYAWERFALCFREEYIMREDMTRGRGSMPPPGSGPAFIYEYPRTARPRRKSLPDWSYLDPQAVGRLVLRERACWGPKGTFLGYLPGLSETWRKTHDQLMEKLLAMAVEATEGRLEEVGAAPALTDALRDRISSVRTELGKMEDSVLLRYIAPGPGDDPVSRGVVRWLQLKAAEEEERLKKGRAPAGPGTWHICGGPEKLAPWVTKYPVLKKVQKILAGPWVEIR